jgi:glycosyltransferase involved in cell wall biosynthesis/GT2 family glycosyltransferase
MTLAYPDLGAELVAERRDGRRTRICIASTDVAGPCRNGGIGAANLRLASALAGAGHEVTLLYVEDWFEQHDRCYWERHFARDGLQFVHLPGRSTRQRQYYEDRAETSFTTYRWLAARDFDVIHFHDRLGTGFHAVHAKRLGLAFPRTTLCVTLHGCVRWGEIGNEAAISEPHFLEIDHMERAAARRADVVISPTRYLLDWVRSEGWELPVRTFVQPLLWDEAAPACPPRDSVDEVVFFGRLELRKGLDLFCDAIDRLCRHSSKPFAVGFLGKDHPIHGVPATEYIRSRAMAWAARPVAIHTAWDTEQALAYLRGAGRMAVVPSRWDNMPVTILECIGSGVPFLASRTGGIPEEIHPDDRAGVLFELSADSLADRLRDVLHGGAMRARLGFDPEHNTRTWVDWHGVQGTSDGPPRRAAGERPLISVCLAHRERPTWLAQTLRSLQRQAYGRFEVLVVDDESENGEAQEYLTRLEHDLEPRGWRLFRQERAGRARAWNLAASQASGEYLLFLSAEHSVRPDALEVLATAAGETRENVYASGGDVFEGAEDPVAGTPVLARILPLGSAPALGLWRCCFSGSTSLMKREWFLGRGGFPEAPGIDEHWEFLAAAVLDGQEIAVVPEQIYWQQRATEATEPEGFAYRGHVRLVELYRKVLPVKMRDLATLLHALSREREAARPVGETRQADADQETLLRRWAASECNLVGATDDPVRLRRGERDPGPCLGAQDFRLASAETLEARFQLEALPGPVDGEAFLTLDVHDRIGERTLVSREIASRDATGEMCVGLSFRMSPTYVLEFRARWHGGRDVALSHVDVVRPGRPA